MSEGVDHSSTIKFNDVAIEVKLALSSSIQSAIPPRCEFVFEYLEENFNARLDDAASFVSEIYSKFPTLSEDEKTKLKESRLGFYNRKADVEEVEVNEFKKVFKGKNSSRH